MIKNDFKQKKSTKLFNKFGVLGLGRTGRSIYQKIKDSNTIFYDDNIEILNQFVDSTNSSNLAQIDDPRWLVLDTLYVSPGINPKHALLKKAKDNNIKISSDLDLFYYQNSSKIFIGVTGTNGKSTVVSLIAHIFEENNIDFDLGGNIGIPILSLVNDKSGYIIELSSFQLEFINNFYLDYAILTNITQDHINYHGNYENYINAKKKMFSYLKEKGYAIINYDNVVTNKIYHELRFSKKFQVIPFSLNKILKNGVSILANRIYDNICNDNKNYELPKNVHLQGTHNSENILAAYIVAKLNNIVIDQILLSISNFRGLPHRMEYIGSKDNIYFYNDSKATNSDSAIQSLKALKSIYWLAGGDTKGSDLSVLSSNLDQVQQAYFYGKDRQILMNNFKDCISCQVFESLYEAFAKLIIDIKQDKTLKKSVLLAPAAASTDQFRDFEHRGQIFTELVVNQLKYNL